MDKNFQPFRTIQPCAGRLLRAIEYSANNDMILVVPGDCQAIVLNREGMRLLKNNFILKKYHFNVYIVN
jgi:hypothetical protein